MAIAVDHQLEYCSEICKQRMSQRSREGGREREEQERKEVKMKDDHSQNKLQRQL